MIRQDTMEQIIRSQQEQIAGLLETNRSLVESNGKLLEQTDALQRKIQELLEDTGTAFTDSMAEPSAFRAEE